MPILKPYLVLLRDGDILHLLVGQAFVDSRTIRNLIAFFDREQIVRHGLVGELVHERREEVHAAVDDVEGAARAVRGWREVVVEFGVEVEFVLDEAREVGAEDAGFVGGGAGAVVADGGVFAEGYAYADDLIHILAHIILVALVI